MSAAWKSREIPSFSPCVCELIRWVRYMFFFFFYTARLEKRETLAFARHAGLEIIALKISRYFNARAAREKYLSVQS